MTTTNRTERKCEKKVAKPLDKLPKMCSNDKAMRGNPKAKRLKKLKKKLKKPLDKSQKM